MFRSLVLSAVVAGATMWGTSQTADAGVRVRVGPQPRVVVRPVARPVYRNVYAPPRYGWYGNPGYGYRGYGYPGYGYRSGYYQNWYGPRYGYRSGFGINTPGFGIYVR